MPFGHQGEKTQNYVFHNISLIDLPILLKYVFSSAPERYPEIILLHVFKIVNISHARGENRSDM
jgi:hypothetical protein